MRPALTLFALAVLACAAKPLEVDALKRVGDRYTIECRVGSSHLRVCEQAIVDSCPGGADLLSSVRRPGWLSLQWECWTGESVLEEPEPEGDAFVIVCRKWTVGCELAIHEFCRSRGANRFQWSKLGPRRDEDPETAEFVGERIRFECRGGAA